MMEQRFDTLQGHRSEERCQLLSSFLWGHAQDVMRGKDAQQAVVPPLSAWADLLKKKRGSSEGRLGTRVLHLHGHEGRGETLGGGA